jgi:replicative DNA helicase
LVDGFHKWQADGVGLGEVVPTPWPELDELFSGGFHPGRSFVIGGRLGEGKSIVGIQCAQVAAEQGFRTLVISEEMSGLEVTGRMMAAGARVEYREITRCAMGAETQARVAEYSDTNRNMPLWVMDKPGLTIEYIAAVARTMKRRQGLDMLVVDYLQLLDASDKRVSREQQVAHIAKAVKDLARELQCVIIILAQLNRENEKAKRKPTPADLRESDAIGQHADAVIMLYHELTDEGDPTGMVTLIVGKNRFGRKDSVTLRWRGHQARIGD